MNLNGIAMIALGCLASLGAVAADRWYDPAMVESGAQLFQQHCAVCHGANAEGIGEWKKPDANATIHRHRLTARPMPGTTRFHSLARSIKQGGVPLGGVMPGFAKQLDDQQVLALIAWIQSKWPEENYRIWHDRHMQ